MKLNVWVVGAVCVVVGVGAGIAIMRTGSFGAPVTQPPPQNAAYASSVAGTVVSHTTSSITLKLADGSTKEYALTPSTRVLATVAAGEQPPTLSTLKNGALVSLTLSMSNGQSVVASITLAPSVQTTTTFSR